MGTTFGKLLQNINSMNPIVAQSLLQLDGHVILSKADLDYRYNILDLHHKKHSTTITTKSNGVMPYDKEWAFGHIMKINNQFYFSARPTTNREVEEHSVSSSIYNNLLTNQVFDVDRDARLIDVSNVTFIVNTLLNLRSKGLIP
ncbi:hypothetical protein GKZ28_11085 [Clostridium chromiireducens]|uniref:Uncharacterized protein n=1 Tax=Clostridium chromiireducens TaxID=225345 RepID=A0A964RM88_9CLOT|nr:hypothetical protein [Clostridium chromiireducens]MVX64234.1 hypothetical protein [Clostridium chromiireducens]